MISVLTVAGKRPKQTFMRSASSAYLPLIFPMPATSAGSFSGALYATEERFTFKGEKRDGASKHSLPVGLQNEGKVSLPPGLFPWPPVDVEGLRAVFMGENGIGPRQEA